MLTFQSPPRISEAEFTQVLQRGTSAGVSPVAPMAAECYQIIVGYGLDPAVALGFFAHESQFGTTGVTTAAKNWGNVRTAYDPSRADGTVTSASGHGQFVKFRTWQDGLRDWCERILNRYIGERGLTTVEAAIPVYAPAADNNDEQAYIDHVNRLVVRWQAEDPQPTAQPGGDPMTQLKDALLSAAFSAVGATYHPEWAFHQYAMQEAQAGRFLGSPLGESRRVSVNGQDYAVQVFALDTLYTPIASPESSTDWSDVRRLSALLKS